MNSRKKSKQLRKPFFRIPTKPVATVGVFPDALQKLETTFAGNMNEDWSDEEEEATEREMKGVVLKCVSLATLLIVAVTAVIFLLTKLI